MGKKKGGKAGKWNKTEHDRFIKALAKYGKNWSMIQKCVQTRTLVQVRSHAQKLFLSMSPEQLEKFEEEIAHRYEMFCNSQKKEKKNQNSRPEVQLVQSERQNVNEEPVQVEISNKSDDSKDTQSKKLNVCQIKVLNQNKHQNNSLDHEVRFNDDLRNELLRSQSRISSIIDQLNKLPKLPIYNYGPLLQLNMNLMNHLMWSPY